MSKHTPGPWIVDALGNVWASDTNVWVSDTKICEMSKQPIQDFAYRVKNVDEHEANARLIAAAPELLAALRICEGNISSLAAAHPKVYGEWLTVVSAAISKATGEAK
jgi:hypothetical protein